MTRKRKETIRQIKELLGGRERFCPNKDCPDFGKTGLGNIVKNGHTDGGRQRYLCQTCSKVFTETKGTPFYRLKTDWADVLEVLAAIAKGAPPEAVAEAKKAKIETILRWLERAGKHAQAMEDALIRNFSVNRVELDELWCYVRNKGKKGVQGDHKERNILVLEGSQHASPH